MSVAMVTPSCRGTANAMMRPSSSSTESSTGSSSRSSSQAEPPEGPEKLEGSTSSILPLPLSTNKMMVRRRHTFSRHDNRHALQTDGTYLDKGLGKRKLLDQRSSQHYSFDLISWQTSPASKSASQHCSTYLTSYRANPDIKSLQSTFKIDLPSLHKFHVVTKGHFHRFPHKHHFPLDPKWCRPTTDTTGWFSEPLVTPLHVLAQTQLPFTTRNPWNYSYKFR